VIDLLGDHCTYPTSRSRDDFLGLYQIVIVAVAGFPELAIPMR
jgi:hypothetical protein